MRTIAIANQKGGNGKTTICVNLAAALGDQKRRRQVLDLDPQHSATAWLGVRNVDKGIFSVFTDNGNLSDVYAQTEFTGATLALASTWLVGIERALAV